MNWTAIIVGGFIGFTITNAFGRTGIGIVGFLILIKLLFFTPSLWD
jgi:hypothetical protein